MKVIAAGLVLALLFLQYRLWIGEGSLADLRQLESRVHAQTLENAELRERNERLEIEVMDLKDGIDAVEHRARSELGMIRDDEVFYLFLEP